jgi:hypothetical protein
MYLAKYRDLRAPESLDHLGQILTTQSFWAARPDTLNDPMEFIWGCSFTPSHRTTGLLAAVLHRTKVKSAAEALFLANRAVEQKRVKTYAMPAISLLQQRCREEVGLICFSTSVDDSLLWNRYGGAGVGVCICLEAAPKLLGDQLHHVSYLDTKSLHVDEILEASLEEHSLSKFYRAAFLTKPMTWKEECEVRFVSRRQSVSVRLDSSPIFSITLGSRLNECLERKVMEIINRLPNAIQVLRAAA